ncbi:interleukin-1 receptor-like 2 [Trematomus bernacchii]|uniref:interleukin-1 receptor-like 2 n=1 Tax=Trematomus bernacchii TaxID=40690 RepID=UPI00146DF7BB|nr:interleukin-1 receptor-like 2 [Trematomus bernacchii]
MTAAGWVILLSVTFTVAQKLSGEADTYHVSAGYLFVLRCPPEVKHTNVTWSRGGGHNLSLPSGVEVIDGLLCFLPVQMSHNGSYTCEKWGETGVTIGLSVSSEKCPEVPETKPISAGVNDGVPCKQPEIFNLKTTTNTRWLKDCEPVQRYISVEERGLMRLNGSSESDAGKYTCMVDVTFNGRKFTAARSIRLAFKNIEIAVKPEVIYPQQDVVVVKEGTTAELKCKAYIGISEEHDTYMYWTVDNISTDDFTQLSDSWQSLREEGRVFGLSTLSISEVHRQFINVPISCCVRTTLERKCGVARLQEADHSALYTSVSLCISASLAVAAFLFFKVDLVLAYRKVLRHFSKQQISDGKLYDAYVSFLHPDTLTSDVTANFALQILPKEMEKHGYSLFIRGRDDCPGEAVHDVIAAMVRRCHRLIIILSPDIRSSTEGETEEVETLCDNQTQLCYEQKIGVHDALTRNEPRVILVEIGSVDYRCLPESLRYIKRKQGALKWKKPSLKTNTCIKFRSNRNFWKSLRYNMPSVPSGKLHTIV